MCRIKSSKKDNKVLHSNIKSDNILISIDLPCVDDNLDAKVYLFRQEINMHAAGYPFQQDEGISLFCIFVMIDKTLK